jgi:anti-sigma regulatory factor (Ser/Thr protein kinase)
MDVTPSERESRDVHISVPARPGYLVLARLALSAICRLTPLGHAEVADLKLAITEAASGFVSDTNHAEALVEFDFRLRDDRIELELRGAPVGVADDERELSRAIVEATVDDIDLSADRALLVKRFAAAA